MVAEKLVHCHRNSVTVILTVILKSPEFLAPNGMSKSGAANVPRGNANAGCPK